jgi:glycosyltransferase involved in cell wall biosynthesis
MTSSRRYARAAGDHPLLIGMEWFDDVSGGLNRYVRDLHHALRRSGSDVRTIVVGPMARTVPGVTATSDTAARLPVRLGALLRLAGADRSVSVVDAHFALYALLPLLLPLRHTPLLVHFHGPWEGESRAQGQTNPVALKAKAAIERAVYRRAERVVVLSRAFARIVAERYGVAPWRVEVVRPGVDLDAFTPGDVAGARRLLGVPAEGYVVVAVRRLVHRMGLGDLLEAWWLSGLGDAGGTLLVVGEGPERAALERRIAELGLSGCVRLLGRVPDDVLVTCYRAADVCVVPSADLEGFGLVVLESLACGTPVVATDVGGLPEILGDLQPDLVVPRARPDLLAARLLGAAHRTQPVPDPAACRAFAEAFGWPASAQHHERLYEAVARRAKGSRLSVVYVDHCASLSGAELSLLRLLTALPEVDAHVVLAVDGPLVERLRAASVSVEVIRMPDVARLLRRDAVRGSVLAAGAATASAMYVGRLTHRLRELRPDLVHTNSLKAALYGGLAARIAGIPVVWHLHDRISDDYLPPGAVRLVRRAARWLPDAVIANSAATRATLGTRSGTAVISSPVDQSVRHRVHSGPFTVGVLGRLAPWKGQEVFLRAFAQAFPDGASRAVLIGAALFGEEDYADGLRTLARRLGIAHRVEFRGFRDDVAAELARLDVLVHCSTMPEPFGQVVVEGMAAGLPVVATAAGGPAEVVSHDVDGLLYPPGDTAALAAALRLLEADEPLRNRLGAQARRSARRFRPQVVAEQVMGVYREVLARDTRPASRYRSKGEQ